ncbi:MAG: hypothetical protein HC880_03010 [Bacteroidia bacterium]|nr:hypothetical protein [Bacteroidia bacterium]
MIFEHVVHETKPANLAAQIVWLDIHEMKRLESLYEDWTYELRKNGNRNQARLSKLNNHFIQLLLQLYERKEG